jgi:glycerophosphoryl diester phosphodiesterase
MRGAKVAAGRYPQVIAHRGASRREPENTIAAFLTARTLGSDAVELDVRRLADGELVVMHDAHLDDGRALVALGRDDVPFTVPTLSAALDACAGMWVNIEIKNEGSEPDYDPHDLVAEQLAKHLRNRGEPERWLISSFRRETIVAMRDFAPEVRTAWLMTHCDPRGVNALAKSLADEGHSALHPWHKVVTREMLDAFHQRGLSVNCWTCDDEDDMSRLVEWGIDGICTNVPDVARTVRESLLGK